MKRTFKALAATTFLFAMLMYDNIMTPDEDSEEQETEQVIKNVPTHVTEKNLK